MATTVHDNGAYTRWTGIMPQDGGFLARTFDDDKTFKTERGAVRWLGTLAAVAAMFASGRMRIAGPEDVIPPRAVTDRLRISWKDVLRVDVNGRVVWIGYQFASSEALVLDDDGRIVRAKKAVAAAHEAMSLHIASKRERRMHRMGHSDGCDCDTCKAPIVHTICHERQE